MAIAGAVLYFWIIPDQVETVAFGWLKPHTLPDVIAIAITILGLFHFIFPSGSAEVDVRVILRIGLFLVVIIASIFLMKLIGFLIAAPIMMAVLMLLIGEKRPLWLGLGVLVIPTFIWFTVDYLLKRPLP